MALTTKTTKPGMRLRSASCTVEIVVIKAPEDSVDLRCGGYEMVPLEGAKSEPKTGPKAGFDEGTVLGKRYSDDTDQLEVLCTKAGASSLSIGDARLSLAGAKALPSSD